VNLAYLGEDGDIKHGKNGLLGAVAPMNLSEDGDVEFEVHSVGSVGSIDTDNEFMLTLPMDAVVAGPTPMEIK
jgi:hypothetical protein